MTIDLTKIFVIGYMNERGDNGKVRVGVNDKVHETYELAEAAAKQRAATDSDGDAWAVFTPVAYTKPFAPAVEVVKI